MMRDIFVQKSFMCCFALLYKMVINNECCWCCYRLTAIFLGCVENELWIHFFVNLLFLKQRIKLLSQFLYTLYFQVRDLVREARQKKILINLQKAVLVVVICRYFYRRCNFEYLWLKFLLFLRNSLNVIRGFPVFLVNRGIYVLSFWNVNKRIRR